MDLTEHSSSALEQQREADILRLVPSTGGDALDVGARTGRFSIAMAERFDRVVALDLIKPDIRHPKVECVQGDAASLEFAAKSFDFVMCTEVLEHIPPATLPKVCQELERVANNVILIGIPYRQDIRVGRTTCYTCGRKNPPWGHVNSFDEHRLKRLFALSTVKEISHIGLTKDRTNVLAAFLMDLAGNPFGTYDQEECCIHCGQKLIPPPERSLPQRVFTRLAGWSRDATQAFVRPRASWLHMLLSTSSS